MLNVERGVDVDAVAQQLLDVEVALGVAAARDIGVGEFIDQGKLRAAREQSVEIHFLQLTAFVFEAMARNDLEAVNKRFGLCAAMGLDHAHDDIVAVLQSRARLLQHLIGLADARRRTEKDLQPPGAALLLACLGKQGVRRRALVRLTPLVCHGASVLTRDLVPLAHHGVPARSRARFSASTFTRGSPKRPRVRPSICSATSWRTAFSGMLRAFAMRGTWK